MHNWSGYVHTLGDQPDGDLEWQLNIQHQSLDNAGFSNLGPAWFCGSRSLFTDDTPSAHNHFCVGKTYIGNCQIHQDSHWHQLPSLIKVILTRVWVLPFLHLLCRYPCSKMCLLFPVPWSGPTPYLPLRPQRPPIASTSPASSVSPQMPPDAHGLGFFKIVLTDSSLVGAENQEACCLNWWSGGSEFKELSQMVHLPFLLSDLYHLNLFPQSFWDYARPAEDISGIWCSHFAMKHTKKYDIIMPLDQLLLSSRGSAALIPLIQDCLGIPSRIYLLCIHLLHVPFREEYFLDYRALADWLEALGDLAWYHIVIAVMVPSAPQASSSLTTAAVNGGIWRSHSSFSISSGTMSTASSEKHVTRPCSPTPSVGIIILLLPRDSWSLSQRRIAGEESLKSGMLRLSQNSLAAVSCTIIWDFSVARQKAMSYVQLTTSESLRGKSVALKLQIFKWPYNLSVWSLLIHSRLLVSLSCHYGWQWHKHDARPLKHAPRISSLFFMGCSSQIFNSDDFTLTLACLLERLTIEELEAREWTIMAAINIGTLLKYGQAQGVLRCADVLGPLDCNPGAIAATKVKLARKAHTNEDGSWQWQA